jgi:hypothetical protein
MSRPFPAQNRRADVGRHPVAELRRPLQAERPGLQAMMNVLHGFNRATWLESSMLYAPPCQLSVSRAAAGEMTCDYEPSVVFCLMRELRNVGRFLQND